jgi:hypothetical protein
VSIGVVREHETRGGSSVSSLKEVYPILDKSRNSPSALAAVVFKGYEQDRDQSKGGDGWRMDKRGMSSSKCDRCQYTVRVRT